MRNLPAPAALPAAAVLAAAIGLAAPAEAAPIVFQTPLSGLEEVPPNASPGTGSATVVFDDVLHQLQVDVAFADLLAPTVAGHIHCCAPPGTNAGIAVGFAGFPLGVTDGVYSQSFDLTDPGAYGTDFLAANGGSTSAAESALAAGLFAGLAYVNLHSQMFPGGEIRGQLATAAPEPAAVGLLLLGLAGLVAQRRR